MKGAATQVLKVLRTKFLSANNWRNESTWGRVHTMRSRLFSEQQCSKALHLAVQNALTDTILTPRTVNTTSLEWPSSSKRSHSAARPTNAGPHSTCCLRESPSYQSLDRRPEISLCTCRITDSSRDCCPKTKGCYGPEGRWAELPWSTCDGHMSSVRAQDCPPYASDVPISVCGKEIQLHSSIFLQDAGPGHMLAPETHLSQLTWSSAEGA